MKIHSCSYYCQRPACIEVQRDELVAKYVVQRIHLAVTEREECALIADRGFKYGKDGAQIAEAIRARSISLL